MAKSLPEDGFAEEHVEQTLQPAEKTSMKPTPSVTLNFDPIEYHFETGPCERPGTHPEKPIELGGPDEAFIDFWAIPELRYTPMDRNLRQVRLLVLHPYKEKDSEQVQCSLIVASMADVHLHFSAVRNSRGHICKYVPIIVNRQRKGLPGNLMLFLMAMRKADEPVVLWIREVCLTPEDEEWFRTDKYEDMVFAEACRTIDMTDYWYKVEENGKLPPLNNGISRGPKDWSKPLEQTGVECSTHFGIDPLDRIQTGSEESMTEYQYKPLDLLFNEIRLLLIECSHDFNAPLKGRFDHAPLSSSTQYVCLSYTWGDASRTHTIEINGQILKITKHLDSALRSLRHQHFHNPIWADAISINQEDSRERSREVSRMTDIYEAAVSVAICLGEGDAESDMAMDFIMELQRTSFSWNMSMPADAIKSQIKETFGTEEYAHKWASVYELLRRPYFSRLWIVQEMVLASTPIVLCGDRGIAWNMLHGTALIILSFMTPISEICSEYGISIQKEVKYIRENSDCANCVSSWSKKQHDLGQVQKLAWLRFKQSQGEPFSFLYICHLNRDSNCSDPRDKIYALWNLAKEGRLLDMKPDYRLTIEETYMRFTKAYIEHTKSLDIICTPKPTCSHALNNEMANALPSWCPDWRFKSLMNSYVRPAEFPIGQVHDIPSLDEPLFKASGNTTAITRFYGSPGDRVLVCCGIILDSVAHVFEEYFGNLKLLYEKAKEFCHRNGSKLSEEVLRSEFGSMMLGEATGLFSYDEENINILPNSGEGIKAVQFKTAMRYMGSIQTWIDKRKLIITRDGYMGLSSKLLVQEGDELALLLGCSVPVVLRRHDDHYHLMGDCFVQGWMAGERVYKDHGSDEAFTEYAKGQNAIVIQ
jgi:heterokaryon incompatibility protein (HET)